MTPLFLKKILAAAALLGLALAAAAQPAFPAKTINYVVPYPPGGTTDILGRTIAQRLGLALGSTVIVDNRAGATGTIGGAFVARVAPDGNTLLGTSALQDVMGGQATFVFVPVAAALPQVLAGKVRALAITAAQRAPSLPQVPTMAEAGIKDFVVEQWQAIYAPAGTPPAVVQRLNSEINAILKDREVIAAFDKLGVTIAGGTPQQLADRQRADSERWGKVIKAANIKLD